MVDEPLGRILIIVAAKTIPQQDDGLSVVVNGGRNLGRGLADLCHVPRCTGESTETGRFDLSILLRGNGKKVEPVVGLEPTTCSLRMSCSTTELNWLCTLSALRGGRPTEQGLFKGDPGFRQVV
jgi:hypothetical protein